MGLDFEHLELLRHEHPAWRLLSADSASLFVSFVAATFLEPNARTLSHQDLVEALDGHLFAVRLVAGAQAYPRSPSQYLKDWSDPQRNWLRKFYPPTSDEPSYDLTPAVERAAQWLESLSQRSFVGTQSRLLSIVGMLRETVIGAQADPQLRLADLHSRREAIDEEIRAAELGQVAVLDDRELRERYQLVESAARELLGDFREVEANFRRLDSSARERIALWNGPRGELLDEVLGGRDVIANSDQGRSFRGLWDFLMSGARQDELTDLLGRVCDLAESAGSASRLRNAHHDWFAAGDQAQETVRRLSAQLRRFLDDQVYLENRRITEILHSIESHAIALKSHPPEGEVMGLPEPRATIELPMERPLYSAPFRSSLNSAAVATGDCEPDDTALFDHVYIDSEVLRGNVASVLKRRGAVTLAQVVAKVPLQDGLAELVGYLSLADEDPLAVFTDDEQQEVHWVDRDGTARCAQIPRVTFTMESANV